MLAAAEKTDASAVSLTSEFPPGWAVNFDFAPDPARALRLDQGVRDGLADSLQAVFDTTGRSRGGDDPGVASLLTSIKARVASPALFGAYVELVLAIFAERDAAAESLMEETLTRWAEWPCSAHFVTLDDRDLGRGQSERYRRLLAEEIGCPLEPVADEALAAAAMQLEAAISLLRDAVPDVAAELGALVRQIVLVAPGESADGVVFGGASTFSLWGALVLNADRLGDRLEVAVQLAHETAHCHLFGLALGGRLVENDDADRHPSPLRRDLRPMEGVAHATYVTARMIYALDALIASGRLDADETTRAGAQLDRNEKAYTDGLKTVLAEAQFTTAGAAAFDGLRRFTEARARAGVLP